MRFFNFWHAVCKYGLIVAAGTATRTDFKRLARKTFDVDQSTTDFFVRGWEGKYAPGKEHHVQPPRMDAGVARLVRRWLRVSGQNRRHLQPRIPHRWDPNHRILTRLTVPSHLVPNRSAVVGNTPSALEYSDQIFSMTGPEPDLETDQARFD